MKPYFFGNPNFNTEELRINYNGILWVTLEVSLQEKCFR